MTKKEIISHLNSGRVVDADVRELNHPCGFVRKVQIYPKGIRQDYLVTVEYELASLYKSRDPEGSHLKYGKTYSELETALLDIESYLGKPIEDWVDYTLHPLTPESLEVIDVLGSEQFFENLGSQGDLCLPNGSTFELFRVLACDEENDPDSE